MGSPSVGDVVLVPFPYSGHTVIKKRPALVLAIADQNDLIVCQITSRPYSSARAIGISPNDFARGNLDRTSYARADKLLTISQTIIVRTVGSLATAKLAEVRSYARSLLA